MFLNDNLPYIKSTRNHFLVAVLLSIMIVFIILFLKPFGAGQPGISFFKYQELYFSGYGILIFVSYFMTVYLFNIYLKKTKQWKSLEEVFFLVTFSLIVVIAGHFYTELIINKNPSRINFAIFWAWFRTMYPSFGILLIIVSYFLRKHFAESEKTKLKLASVLNEPLPIQIINIFGSVKKDNFKIEFSKLIYIKSEDNYVFIYYLKNDEIKNKMLRSTLSNIHKQIPKLIKTHRSFLVNPEYIKNLKGNSQNAKLSLHIDSVIIPVSKTYYNTIKSAIH